MTKKTVLGIAGVSSGMLLMFLFGFLFGINNTELINVALLYAAVAMTCFGIETLLENNDAGTARFFSKIRIMSIAIFASVIMVSALARLF